MSNNTVTVFQINNFRIYEMNDEEKDVYYELNKEFNVRNILNFKDCVIDKKIKIRKYFLYIILHLKTKEISGYQKILR